MSNKFVFNKGKSIYSSIYNLWNDNKNTNDQDSSDEDLYSDTDESNTDTNTNSLLQNDTNTKKLNTQKLNIGLLSKKKVLQIATLQGITQTIKSNKDDNAILFLN